MNENLDLVKILKDCPMGTKFYSTMYGEVTLFNVEKGIYPIGLKDRKGKEFWLAKDGRYFAGFDGECTIFPSREQRDWAEFEIQQKDITERVKTFEDACNELGDEHTYVKEYWGVVNVNLDITQDLIAYLKLRIISAALNEGWVPQYAEQESRWFPWFHVFTEEELKDKSDELKGSHMWMLGDSSHSAAISALSFADTSDVWSRANAARPDRLACKSKELATYFGRQFIGIWAEYLFA